MPVLSQTDMLAALLFSTSEFENATHAGIDKAFM
jgi:hypothetical protein